MELVDFPHTHTHTHTYAISRPPHSCARRSEFKAHKEATGEQVAQFMHAWQSYLEQLQEESGQVIISHGDDRAPSPRILPSSLTTSYRLVCVPGPRFTAFMTWLQPLPARKGGYLRVFVFCFGACMESAADTSHGAAYIFWPGVSSLWYNANP